MSVVAYHDPISIGDGDDFGPYVTLATYASHSMSTNDSNIGVAFADGFYPSGGGANATGVSIANNIDQTALDWFIGLSVSQNIASMPGTLYGVKLSVAAEGSGGDVQYGLYIEPQILAGSCYAIYTNEGEVHFGSLAGTGNRQVWVTSDGTLYA